MSFTGVQELDMAYNHPATQELDMVRIAAGLQPDCI